MSFPPASLGTVLDYHHQDMIQGGGSHAVLGLWLNGPSSSLNQPLDPRALHHLPRRASRNSGGHVIAGGCLREECGDGKAGTRK